MKKFFIALISVLLLVGCGTTPSETTETTTEETVETTESAATGNIFVYTRDSSSGTREAFEKAIGLEELTADAIEAIS